MTREGWDDISEGWDGLRITAAALACALLASCGTSPPPEPEIRIVEVKVPVPVPCVPPTVDIKPDFQVTRVDVVTAPTVDERYRLTAAGMLERDAYIAEMTPVLQGCRDAAGPFQ